jgi:hypothetical protein
MILLVTSISRSNECAAALKEATGEPVVVAANLLEAMTLLRTESCRAAVFDHHLIEREPQETEIAFEHLGAAIPIEVNFALSGIGRLVREVRAALGRQSREQAAARDAAIRALHSELNQTLTALCLKCDLALQTHSLPPGAAEKIRCAQALVEKLHLQLESKSATH